MFAVLVDASAGWRGVKVTPVVSRQLEGLPKNSEINDTFQAAA